jgi:hypothetical protein
LANNKIPIVGFARLSDVRCRNYLKGNSNKSEVPPFKRVIQYIIKDITLYFKQKRMHSAPVG